MTVRNLSPTTQQSYIHAVKKFSLYFGRSLDRLGLEHVHAYQVRLVAQQVAWSSLNQTVSALRFFYRVTLSQKDLPELIPYARRPKTVPIVLSPQEVARFLEAIRFLRGVRSAPVAPLSSATPQKPQDSPDAVRIS
jgi:integrase/recombinase XerD